MHPAPRIVVSAGEASGDRHAAALVTALRARHPGLRIGGMGGTALAAAGVELWVDSSELGVIGLGELIGKYFRIRRALAAMQRRLAAERPDLLICVDYKEFNFRLARAAKAAGVKVLFYVSPQVWAWRPQRVLAYGRAVDHMAVIFPFEVPFYQAHGIPVTYVGHPLAGQVHSALSPSQARQEFGIDPKGPVFGILPGSRQNELQRLLPIMLDAARLLAAEFPAASFILPAADSLPQAGIDAALSRTPLPIQVVRGRFYDVLSACDAVMTASGTATLECALMGVPMAICYRLSPLSYWLATRLVRVSWIGLPNIVAETQIVREFIQHQATAANLAGELRRLLCDEAYAESMRDGLREVARRIGRQDGIRALADVADSLLA